VKGRKLGTHSWYTEKEGGGGRKRGNAVVFCDIRVHQARPTHKRGKKEGGITRKGECTLTSAWRGKGERRKEGKKE